MMSKVETLYPLPAPPEGASTVLCVGKAIIATTWYEGRPAVYNPPELACPEEPGELGPLFLYLPSKKRWVELRLEEAPHLEEQVYEALQRQIDSDYDDYRIQLETEQALYEGWER
jgi:hypothetical protein